MKNKNDSIKAEDDKVKWKDFACNCAIIFLNDSLISPINFFYNTQCANSSNSLPAPTNGNACKTMNSYKEHVDIKGPQPTKK